MRGGIKFRGCDFARRRDQLLAGKGYFMYKLLIINSLDLHVNAVRFCVSLVLADAKGLSALGRALMDDIEFRGGMLLEEVAKNEFGLRFTVRPGAIIKGDVYSLIQVTRQLFRAARFNSFLYLVDYVALRK